MTINKLIRLITGIAVFLLPCMLDAQNIIVTNSNHLIFSGRPFLVINNGRGFYNNGVLGGTPPTSNKSTVVLTCSCASAIGGANSSTFYNLTVNLDPKNKNTTPNVLTMGANISVKDSLTFPVGSYELIELNGNTIDLINTGVIINERDSSRITGINGGTVTIVYNFTSPNGMANVNPGNIGLSLTTIQTLGSTHVTRGHQMQTNLSGGENAGLYRYFDVIPQFNPSGNSITARYYFFDGQIVDKSVDATSAKNVLTLWKSPFPVSSSWSVM